MTLLKERALSIREAEANRQKREEENIKSEAKTLKARILREFEEQFEDELPMLEEAEIKYSAHMVDYRYRFNGTYIQFELKGNVLKMEFNGKNHYRYEFCPKQMGSMQFGEWDKDRFITFIYEGLIEVML